MEPEKLLNSEIFQPSSLQLQLYNPANVPSTLPENLEDAIPPAQPFNVQRKPVGSSIRPSGEEKSQPISHLPALSVGSDQTSITSTPPPYEKFEDITDYISRKGRLSTPPRISAPPQIARLRWGFFTTYRRLFALVFTGNAIALITILTRHRTLPAVANAAAANLAVCGLIRVPYVVNVFYALICCVPRKSPMWLRHAAAEIPHFGGVHSGCGVAALVWYVALCGLVTREYVTGPALLHDAALVALMYLILCLILFIVIAAYPAFRFKAHDAFELTHRFSAWMLIPLFWAFLLVFTNKQAEAQVPPSSLAHELVAFPAFWFAIVLTVAFFVPWISLRKVKVESEYLSAHAVRLHFEYATTGFAQGVSVSKNPLRDWHSFAGIPNVDDKPGFSLIVSKAGDWTGSVIKEQPTALWTRGVPTSGFGRNCLLFNKLLLVTTGSGMGPCLSLLSAKNRPPIRILWQTRSPLKTYGDEVLRLISMVDKNAVVIDSDKHGRQDMFPIAWNLFKDYGAEGVFIISRPGIVQKLVFEFEARGIPAFGPVFDS